MDAISSLWHTLSVQAQAGVITAGTGTTITIIAVIVALKSRRIQTAEYITPYTLKRHKSLFGKVTAVNDGDGFRLFHLPGIWRWRTVPTKVKSDQTISIRLAGVDAPELPHFGNPGQPFAEEAIEFLRSQILHKRITIKPYRKDQYGRLVASAHVPYYVLWKKDVGLEMLRNGLAVVYNQAGAEYGGREVRYLEEEKRAKSKKIGIWSLPNFVSPSEYKAKNAAKQRT
ncbi:hypothetical protein SmJEL517_g01092 [Synchytrium microbalum]|uniref:TNase-like domain-containing protein n=1 Tax=Synchytrium microbalum TaxID=1806994 RepID=A0A507CGD7_9FUNG|nr:uncharacterized protein SmJEL517_g01092 [Synchytrium microbalum]TPX37086.1 hypothetical protein SmJEL517_g01092 [Synchytrium microbalum]